jgi:hypothetical protein
LHGSNESHKALVTDQARKFAGQMLLDLWLSPTCDETETQQEEEA